MSSRFISLDPAVLEKKNLLVIAPTGSGKTTNTLRACWDLLLSRKFRRVIICAPTRAACEDIARTARKIAGEENVGVDTSDARLEKGWKLEETWAKPIVVTTYERADSVLLSNPDLLRDAILVIDEAHNILYPDRATAIIDLLALARMMQDQGAKTRIVLLSATMPMVEKLREYLNAEVVTKGERPVKLEVKTIEVPPPFRRGAQPYYAAKVEELKKLLQTLSPDYAPILVYVPSKTYAELVAQELKKAASRGEISWLKPDEVAVHHAGLPYAVRREIEEELKKPNPKYKIVVATDTLSQSVNLAFRTVVVLGLKLFKPDKVEYVLPATIMQVLGRAGRPGYQNVAYGFILYTPDEKEIVEKALAGAYGEIETIGDYLALPLRLIYAGRDIELWLRYAPFIDRDRLSRALRVLEDMKFVRKVGDKYELTPIGKLAAREYLPSTTFGFLLALSLRPYLERLEEDNYRDKARTALAIAGGLSYLMQRMWTQERQIEEKKLTATPPPPVHTVDADTAMSIIEDTLGYTTGDTLRYDYPPFVGLSDWAKLLEPDAELPLLVVYNPQLYSADTVAESLRKAGQVIESAVREGVLPREYEKLGRVLVNIFKTYRRLLKQSPQLAEDFIKTFASPLTIAELVKLPHVDLEALYLYMKSSGIRDVAEAYRKYMEALSHFKKVKVSA